MIIDTIILIAISVYCYSIRLEHPYVLFGAVPANIRRRLDGSWLADCYIDCYTSVIYDL